MSSISNAFDIIVIFYFDFVKLGLIVARRLSVFFAVAATPTVQPKNNARTRSGARSSCAARTRKRQKEVKLRFIRKKFKAQEVQNNQVNNRKKLFDHPAI